VIYLDTSALVKKYAIESGTNEIRALLKNEDIIITQNLRMPKYAHPLQGSFEKAIWAKGPTRKRGRVF